jgi:hypothetical protein
VKDGCVTLSSGESINVSTTKTILQTKEELIVAAYAYSRPPSEASHISHLVLTDFVKRRGNSAVFVDPVSGK